MEQMRSRGGWKKNLLRENNIQSIVVWSCVHGARLLHNMKLKIVPTWLLFVFSKNIYLTFSLSLSPTVSRWCHRIRRLRCRRRRRRHTRRGHNDDLTVSTRVATEKWTKVKRRKIRTIYMRNRRMTFSVSRIRFRFVCNVYHYCYPCDAYLKAVNLKWQKAYGNF